MQNSSPAQPEFWRNRHENNIKKLWSFILTDNLMMGFGVGNIEQIQMFRFYYNKI
jgi:hypothetical protein